MGVTSWVRHTRSSPWSCWWSSRHLRGLWHSPQPVHVRRNPPRWPMDFAPDL